MTGLTSIILLTYNQINFTRLCLNSIRLHTRKPYELIIVDNGSTDGTVPFLKAYKTSRVIFNRSNLGYSKGVNQGINAARGQNLLLLNNDTIVSHNWLSNLLCCINSNQKIGVVGPRTNYAGGSQGGVHGDFKSFESIHNFSRAYNQPDPEKWYETDLIVGFCMLIKKEVIDRVGVFDERFKYGMFEDNDFCRRVIEEGYKIYCAGDTFVYHFGSRTFLGGEINMAWIFERNKNIFEKKWGLK